MAYDNIRNCELSFTPLKNLSAIKSFYKNHKRCIKIKQEVISSELERITRPGAATVLTTWGKRFLIRLQEEAKLLAAGQKIGWYEEMCIKRAGDLLKLIESYDRDEFVWFKGSTGKYEDYGEAIISKPAMESLIKAVAPKFEISVYDTTSLPQDVFVLRRKV